ncbi:MAG: class I SAM-dependent methyltransferase [Gammaproteobacteria bacterium]
MNRIPEPELMNDAAQAQAYAHADFAAPHQQFIDTFQERFAGLDISDAVLDLGCGPADISRRFALAYPHCTLHAVDGASHMLAHARRLNQQQGLAQRIVLIEGTLPGVTLPQDFYHTIISNSLLHHLHDPFVLWQTLRQYAKASAHIFIMDLMRPDSAATAAQLVTTYAASEPHILQEDFYHSLLAAFTPREVQHQLEEMAMSHLRVEEVSDRHMIIYGCLN